MSMSARHTRTDKVRHSLTIGSLVSNGHQFSERDVSDEHPSRGEKSARPLDPDRSRLVRDWQFLIADISARLSHHRIYSFLSKAPNVGIRISPSHRERFTVSRDKHLPRAEKSDKASHFSTERTVINGKAVKGERSVSFGHHERSRFLSDTQPAILEISRRK